MTDQVIVGPFNRFESAGLLPVEPQDAYRMARVMIDTCPNEYLREVILSAHDLFWDEFGEWAAFDYLLFVCDGEGAEVPERHRVYCRERLAMMEGMNAENAIT